MLEKLNEIIGQDTRESCPHCGRVIPENEIIIYCDECGRDGCDECLVCADINKEEGRKQDCIMLCKECLESKYEVKKI